MQEQREAAEAGTSFDAVIPTRMRSRRHIQADRRKEGNEAGKQRVWMAICTAHSPNAHHAHATSTSRLSDPGLSTEAKFSPC